MGKTRDLFKKIRHQGNISCKDGLNKGQKWYGPNRSRRLLRRGGKNTHKNYTKKIMIPDNCSGVITYLEPDILECEVKWALESITTNKVGIGNGISAKLF